MDLQFSQTSSTIIQVGNATLTQSDLEASNGVIHVIQNFPCTDTAFNNTMMATLELAGDFGPFNDAKVGQCHMHASAVGIQALEHMATHSLHVTM